MLADRQYLRQWEELIDAVDKTNIPVSFINRVILNFTDRDLESKTIDVRAFRKQGFSNDEIEDIISQIILDSGSKVYAMEFFVDVENVAIEVQKETEKLLYKLL